jgi:hypothetical protein
VLDESAGRARRPAPLRLTHFPSAQAGRPLRHRRTPGVARRGLRALAVVVLLLIIVAVAGLAVIVSGPTEFSIIRDRVQTLLARGLGPDYHVDIGRSVVDVDPALGLVAEIDDIAVRDSRNAVVARVPSIRLALDPLALLSLRVEVSTVELSNAELSFVRSAEGEVYLGNAETEHSASAGPPVPPQPRPRAASPSGFPDLLAALQIVDRGIEPSINAAVNAGFLRFALVDGTISVWDAGRVGQRRFASTDVSVSVDPATSNLTANVASSGYGGRWTATFLRQVDPTTGARALSAEFQQLTIADLFPDLGAETSEVTADIPLYGHATAHFAADGTVQEASTELDVGAGTITFGERREKMLLDEAALKLRWDIPNQTVVIEPSPISFGDTHGIVTGWIKPDGNPGSRRYAFDIESKGAVIAPRDSNEAPLVADRIGVTGKVDLPNNLITIDDAAIVTPIASVAATGSIGIGGPSPMLVLAATFSPMEARALKQIWVPFIAWGARPWVLQHVNGGRLAAGRFDARLPISFIFAHKKPPITDADMRLDLRLEDAEFTTYGELPPVKHAYGNAVLSGQVFTVSMEKGEVETAAGGTVTLDSGGFGVANVFQRGGEGRIDVQLSGEAAGLGEIANSKPFLALQRRQLDPADLSGPAHAVVSVAMPLKLGVTESEVDWKVTVNAKGLSSKAPIEGRTFSDADVTIAASPDAVSIKGKAKINGVAADVAMSQPLGQGGVLAGPGERTARLTLDDAARKRLGIGLDEILGGAVGAQISNIDDGSKGQHYDLDLRRARVVMPGLGWSKAIGVPATLTFDVKPVEGGYSVENIDLGGAGFGFTGSAKLDQNYALMSADLDHFALRQGDSLAFQLTRTKTGYGIVAHGASFDLKGVLDQIENGGDHDVTAPDITIDARVDRLIGFNQQAIAGARLTMASGEGYLQKLNVAGSIGGANLSVTYSDTSDGASLIASSEDAGNVLRFINLYTRVDGGRLSITGQRDGADGPLAGSFELTDFNLMNEPAISQIATPRVGAPTVNLSHAHFDRMVAHFHKLDRRINIDDALLRGATSGATFNGRFDLAVSRMQINGTFIPAYDFSDALSHIPILGIVLTGGGSSGLFGVTFRIEGPLSGPHLLINPLSVVAPGMFRKIFEFH